MKLAVHGGRADRELTRDGNSTTVTHSVVTFIVRQSVNLIPQLGDLFLELKPVPSLEIRLTKLETLPV